MIKSQATPKEVIMDDPVALVLFKPESISTLKGLFLVVNVLLAILPTGIRVGRIANVGLLLEKSQAVD